jgi:two-component system, OmpR family, alkaline phosphatase synthesis response regulator PhoP
MKQRQVLIIDDEEAIQTIVRVGLNMAAGWEVITASAGAEGIIRAQAEQPDLILLDVMMPEMDGIATFKELRQHADTQSIPVIFLTAKAQASDQHLLHNTGANGVITKPFNSLDLAQQICTVMDWQ